jgi:hypothetical protein
MISRSAPQISAAVSCWNLTAQFLLAWFFPHFWTGTYFVRFIENLLVMEFIVIFSRPLMVYLAVLLRERPFWLPIGAAIPLTFLGYFFIGILGTSRELNSIFPIVSFVGLMASRFWSTWSIEADPQFLGEVVNSVQTCMLSFALFMVLWIASTTWSVPRGGLTPDALHQLGLPEGYQPYRSLAFGAIYYLLLGVYELVNPNVFRGLIMGSH